MERTRQTTDHRHPLNGHLGVVPCLKSRRTSLNALSPSTRRRKLLAWSYGENDSSPWHQCAPVLTNSSHLAQGIPGQTGSIYMHTQVGRSRVNVLKWGFSNEQERCDCGIRQTMQHLLVCPMMDTACSPQDLTTANGIAIGCAKHWEGTIWRTYDSSLKDKNNDEQWSKDINKMI